MGIIAFLCCGHEQCGMISTQPECLQSSLCPTLGKGHTRNVIKIDAFELGVVAQACGPSTWEAEEGVSGIQGRSWLQRKLENSLGDLRAYLQTPNPNQTQTKKYLKWNRIKQGT